MKKWRVIILPDAEEDIYSIYMHIATVLLEPVTAAKLVARVKEAISSLSNMPERYRLYDKEPWYSKGLRLFFVSSYIVFYHIAPQIDTVFIDSVVYGGRDIGKTVEEIKFL